MAELALGTAQLGMPYGIANSDGQPDREAAAAILHRALEAGVLTWDTAPVYGESEAVLGAYLKDSECAVRLCTKLQSISQKAVGSSLAEYVHDALEHSLDRLHRPAVTCYLVHDERDYLTYDADLVNALLKLQDEGFTEEVGVSVYAPEVAHRVVDDPALNAMQLPLNLFDHRFDDVVEAAWDSGTTVYARSVFLQGLPFAQHALRARVPESVPYLERLRSLADASGRSVAELAFLYVRDMPGVDHLVVGVETAAQLDANVALAGAEPLDDGLRLEIESAFHDVPETVVNPSLWKPASSA